MMTTTTKRKRIDEVALVRLANDEWGRGGGGDVAALERVGGQ